VTEGLAFFLHGFFVMIFFWSKSAHTFRVQQENDCKRSMKSAVGACGDRACRK